LSVVICFIGNTCWLQAQRAVGEITDSLVACGFENIRTHTLGNTLWISYENAVFRDKAIALTRVLDILTDVGYDTVDVVTLVNDLPIVHTRTTTTFLKENDKKSFSGRQKAWQIRLSYKTDTIWKILRDEKPVNSHTNKVDMVFYPQIAVKNVLINQIYEIQFNLAPALEVSLWRGMRFTGQLIVPIYNDPLYGDESNRIRAGFLVLAQEFRLPGIPLGRLAVGKFDASRYGADLTLNKYFFDSQCELRANIGYTGEYHYTDGNWYREDLNTLTGFVQFSYFFRPYELRFDLSAGRYINDDYGIRFDCTRYWNETTVGFYATSIEGHFNGGFHFALPLCPEKFKKNRRFQLRFPSYFDWEYDAGTETFYGQYYETRPNENRVEQFYNPNYMIKQVWK